MATTRPCANAASNAKVSVQMISNTLERLRALADAVRETGGDELTTLAMCDLLAILIEERTSESAQQDVCSAADGDGYRRPVASCNLSPGGGSEEPGTTSAGVDLLGAAHDIVMLVGDWREDYVDGSVCLGRTEYIAHRHLAPLLAAEYARGRASAFEAAAVECDWEKAACESHLRACGGKGIQHKAGAQIATMCATRIRALAKEE